MPTDPAALDAVLRVLDGRVPVVAGEDGQPAPGRQPAPPPGPARPGDGGIAAAWHRQRLRPRGWGPARSPRGGRRPHHRAARRFDLLEDDTGRVIVNAAHAGLGAEAAAAATDHKPRLGPLAYPLGALLAGIRAEGWALRVSVDGAREPIRSPRRSPAPPHGVGQGAAVACDQPARHGSWRNRQPGFATRR
jgi:hypothetical protein